MFKQKEEPVDLEKLLLPFKTNLSKEQFQLPMKLQPLHYRLQIHPSPEGTFRGTVDILLLSLTKTKTITLDADGLHIIAGTLHVKPEKQQDTIGIEHQKYETSKKAYELSLKSNLEANTNYTVHVEFSGNISNDYSGLYKTKYNRNE